MAAAGKRKARGWGIAALLLVLGAGIVFIRPKPPLVPVAQLEARSAEDARALGASIPEKVSDKVLSLQQVEGLQRAIDQVAAEEGVSVVRVWSSSGTLLASSDASDTTAPTTADKAAIGAASGPTARATSLNDGVDVVRVFEPVSTGATSTVIAEFVRDAREQGLPYKTIAAALAALAVIALIVALVGLFGGSDGSAASEGEETAAAPASKQRTPATTEAGSERELERLARKLKTSEASRAAMETQMEQLRSQLRMGTQGADQIVSDLDNSLASSQARAHEAGEKLAVAEARAEAAEQRAAAAEEALGRAAPSEAAGRLVALEADLAAANASIADRAALWEAAEKRERELEQRAAAAEVRTAQVEAALEEARRRVAELGSLADSSVAPSEAVSQLKLELARSQDLAEQAMAKLEASEAKRTASETFAAEMRSKLEEAERRMPVIPPAAAGVPAPTANNDASPASPSFSATTEPSPPPGVLPAESDPSAWRSLTKRLGRSAPADAAPLEETTLTPEPPSPAASGSWQSLTKKLGRGAPSTEPVAEPTIPPPITPAAVTPATPAPPVPAPSAPAPEDPASATDPTAWKALAKSLRREALGDDAPDEPEDDVIEEPAAELTPDDRSELRARLAKATAKKRRRPE